MTDKLEPCPFCGESNVILDVMSRDHSGSPTDYSPECSTCGATIIRTKDMGHDDAIVAWNTRTAHSGEGERPHKIVSIRVTSMWENCNRTTFYVELTTSEGFTMTPCGHATGSDYTDGKGLSIEEARDRAVTDAGTWGDFLGITPEPFIVDGVEIKPSVPLMLYTTRRKLTARAALQRDTGGERA